MSKSDVFVPYPVRAISLAPEKVMFFVDWGSIPSVRMAVCEVPVTMLLFTGVIVVVPVSDPLGMEMVLADTV